MIPIKGIQKTTLIDFPGKIACTIFLGGCNFKCGYCYNSDLVFRSYALPTISESEFVSFLIERRSFLEGVCITGGEPTIHKELVDFCRKIKDIGYAIKLDTNGSNPSVIKNLLKKKLVDYIAMDIKAPLDKYKEIVKVEVNKEKLKESIELIQLSGVEYEFRTTVVPDKINKAAIEDISLLIKGSTKYYLQQFRPDPKTNAKEYNNLKPLPLKEIEEFKETLKNKVGALEIRT